MRRWVRYLVVTLLVLLVAVPASAVELLPGNLLTPVLQIPLPILTTTPVAFGAVANRYTGVDPATVFDLNGDLVGDLKVSATEVTAQNGAKLQLVEPVALNLDNVQQVPTTGYGAKAALQLNRVYVMQFTSGNYAKFMVLQANPKVTIWFHYGTPTTSVLKADGTGSHAVLSWDALPDATLGYNVYRYEVDGNSYTVTSLTDFPVLGTTYTDDTAAARYYIYAVQAIKPGGGPGNLTTVAAVFVQYKLRKMVVTPNTTTAKVDTANVTLATQPVIKNGLMMVPASMFTNAGAKVTVNGNNVTIARRIGDVTYTVTATLDTPEYTWNGATYKFDVVPYKVGSEVMVALRTVAPVLGLGVSFNSTDRNATLQWSE